MSSKWPLTSAFVWGVGVLGVIWSVFVTDSPGGIFLFSIAIGVPFVWADREPESPPVPRTVHKPRPHEHHFEVAYALDGKAVGRVCTDPECYFTEVWT